MLLAVCVVAVAAGARGSLRLTAPVFSIPRAGVSLDRQARTSPRPGSSARCRTSKEGAVKVTNRCGYGLTVSGTPSPSASLSFEDSVYMGPVGQCARWADCDTAVSAGLAEHPVDAIRRIDGLHDVTGLGVDDSVRRAFESGARTRQPWLLLPALSSVHRGIRRAGGGRVGSAGPSSQATYCGPDGLTTVSPTRTRRGT